MILRSTTPLIVISLLFSECVWGQTPTIQDCLGAIPVCQAVYSEALSPSGDGNYHNEINTAISCTAGELNSIWYIFNAAQNGDLSFVITPNNLNDDYDWTLFDITNATCADILTNPSLQVSCNAAGGNPCHGATGATGATVYDEQGGGCGNFPPTQTGGYTPFNALVPMIQGHTYVLMVSNWTGSFNGYTLDFSQSTGIGIFDLSDPTITSIETPTKCYQNKITVNFSEYIKCNSVNSSNFQLLGPGGPYSVTLSNPICATGGDHANSFDLTITPAIRSRGDFTLKLLSNGINQVLDLCGNSTQPVEIPFSVTEFINLPFSLGPDTSLLCNGDVFTLDATIPNGSYVWNDGSTNATLMTSSAGVYSVTVTDACGTGSDDLELLVLFDVPQLDLGSDPTLCTGETLPFDLTQDFASYQWQDGNTNPQYTVTTGGAYGVTVTNVCGSVSDAINVTYIPPVTLDLGADPTLCAGQTQMLDVSHPYGTYLWQNGSTNPQFTITSPGSYAVTVTTPCETQTDGLEVIYINPPQLALSGDTTLCPQQTISYDLTVPGATYVWQDGSTNPVFLVDQTGDYAVTVTHACGTFNANVAVTILDSIRTELGRDTFLCPGEPIILNADAGSAAHASYQWSDGSSDERLTVKAAGRYVVYVTNLCEQVTDQVEIKECERCDVFAPTVFSPNDDGVNDDFRPLSDCLLDNYHLRIFDRWGSQVFETTNPEQGWNGKTRGKHAAAGVYVWWIEYTVIENNRPRNASETGDVTIIR